MYFCHANCSRLVFHSLHALCQWPLRLCPMAVSACTREFARTAARCVSRISAVAIESEGKNEYNSRCVIEAVE